MLRLLEKLQELKEKKTIEGAIITHFAHYKTGHGTMRATVYLEPRKNEPAELWESRVAALVEEFGGKKRISKKRIEVMGEDKNAGEARLWFRAPIKKKEEIAEKLRGMKETMYTEIRWDQEDPLIEQFRLNKLKWHTTQYTTKGKPHTN